MREVSIDVNGSTRRTSVEAGESLLRTIRDRFELTGAKSICEIGTCGGCTVLIDDSAVYSCLVLTAECDLRRVDTVEGLADGSSLSRLQAAFAECDALQCGYCTPGQLMSLEALRRSTAEPSHEDIVGAVQGNLCRCGAYRHIIDAAHRTFGSESPSPENPGPPAERRRP